MNVRCCEGMAVTWKVVFVVAMAIAGLAICLWILRDS
jgi:hypothetical protein